MVKAQDPGHLFATAQVSVDIQDTNDCPPKFTEENYTAVVQVTSFSFILVLYYLYNNLTITYLSVVHINVEFLSCPTNTVTF